MGGWDGCVRFMCKSRYIFSSEHPNNVFYSCRNHGIPSTHLTVQFCFRFSRHSKYVGMRGISLLGVLMFAGAASVVTAHMAINVRCNAYDMTNATGVVPWPSSFSCQTALLLCGRMAVSEFHRSSWQVAQSIGAQLSASIRSTAGLIQNCISPSAKGRK